MECIFCKIVRNEVQSFKIYEDEKVVGVLDIMPASKGQILIIPKEHYENFYEVPDETILKMFSLSKLIGRIFVETFKAKGFHIIVNNGQIAGQTQPHICVFVVPRYGSEQVVVGWQKNQADPKELEEIMKKFIEEMSLGKIKEEKKESKKKENEELLKIVYMADVVRRRKK